MLKFEVLGGKFKVEQWSHFLYILKIGIWLDRECLVVI